MALPSRKTTRAKVAELLTATGSFDNVTAYDPNTLNGATKWVAVRSAGSRRQRIVSDTRENRFRFEIVLYLMRSGESAPAESIVEDALDDYEQAVADFIDTTPVLDGWWTDLAYDENGSESIYVLVDGLMYRSEVIPIVVQIL
jgi:hypothetical protein